MKILSVLQTRQADAYTVAHEGISSIDLMERASRAFVNWFVPAFPLLRHQYIAILCGKGNNGGDGLAIARLLHDLGYQTRVYIIAAAGKSSDDFEINYERLCQYADIAVVNIDTVADLPPFEPQDLLIDAILGSGLSRPITAGVLADIIHAINDLPNLVVAVDIPTGLFTDQRTAGAVIRASYTCTFEYPKLSFLFPATYPYVGEFTIQPIGLSAAFIHGAHTPNHYITADTVARFFKVRDKFAHKGVFGHALLVVGSYGKMGAAILATKACLRAGVGLVTVHVPTCGYEIMQTTVPEAMVSLDEDPHIFTRMYDIQKYTTVALGCGLSTKNKTRNALCYVLKNLTTPVVLDADALNILGQSPDWLEFIPKNSILTPHPKEFERLFGVTHDDFHRYDLQRQKAQELGVYVILKGANSCIATPEGDCYFNSTGNPGMGTAGSGDVLTGILSGLLAQHYTPLEACILGVYLHGLSGDIAAEAKSQEALTAGDIIDYLGEAFKCIHNNR
jgi:ADP-dependent NAD(P)H-hydrate dehydratase / NAD(P)H-hydrate epimerase